MAGLFSNLYKAAIPVNARMALEQFSGTAAPITEKDFTPEELDAIRLAIQNTQKSNIERENKYLSNLNKTKEEYEKDPEYYSVFFSKEGDPKGIKPYEVWKEEQKKAVESFEKTRDKTSFGYGSYDVKSGDMAAPVGQGWLDALYQSYTDPAFRVAATLGSANYYDKKGQTPYIQDSYGFSSEHPAVYGDVSKLSTLDIIKKFGDRPGSLLELLASRLAPQRRPVNIALPNEKTINLKYTDPFAPTIK